MINKFAIKPYFKRPRLVTEPVASVAFLFRNTARSHKEKAKNVRINGVKLANPPPNLTKLGYMGYALDTTNTENGHRYLIRIFTKKPVITPRSKIIFESGVGVTVFYYEYANAHKYGIQMLYRCNGDPPVQTNPRLRIGADHHTLASIAWLIKNTPKLLKGLAK